MLSDLVVGSRRIGWSSGAGICTFRKSRAESVATSIYTTHMRTMLKREGLWPEEEG
jgi:hypothetical protein